jgi:hypothetical protein
LSDVDRDDAHNRRAFRLVETDALVAAAPNEVVGGSGLLRERVDDRAPAQDLVLAVDRGQPQLECQPADDVPARILALLDQLLVEQAAQDAMRGRARQLHRLRNLAQADPDLRPARDVLEDGCGAPDRLRTVGFLVVLGHGSMNH